MVLNASLDQFFVACQLSIRKQYLGFCRLTYSEMFFITIVALDLQSIELNMKSVWLKPDFYRCFSNRFLLGIKAS